MSHHITASIMHPGSSNAKSSGERDANHPHDLTLKVIEEPMGLKNDTLVLQFVRSKRMVVVMTAQMHPPQCLSTNRGPRRSIDRTIMPVLLDVASHNALQSISWSINTGGQVSGAKGGAKTTMQQSIMCLDGNGPRGFDVEHFNHSHLDNRRANLRLLRTPSMATRVPLELRNLGIVRLPRGVLWDAGLDKFVVKVQFRDHDDDDNDREIGHRRSSVVDQFHRCLAQYIQYLQAHPRTRMHVEPEAVILAEQFNAVVRAAHVHSMSVFPDGPYINLDTLEDELCMCRSILRSLPSLAPSTWQRLRMPGFLRDSVGVLDDAKVDGAKVDGAKVDGAKVDGAKVDGAKVDGAKVDAPISLLRKLLRKLL
jgi:hypothetical protein